MHNGRYHVDDLPYFSWVRSALPLRLSKRDLVSKIYIRNSKEVVSIVTDTTSFRYRIEQVPVPAVHFLPKIDSSPTLEFTIKFLQGFIVLKYFIYICVKIT